MSLPESGWRSYGKPGHVCANGLITSELHPRVAFGNPAGVRAIDLDDLIAERQMQRREVTPELEQALARIGANPDWR